jgi:hypothetical protein
MRATRVGSETGLAQVCVFVLSFASLVRPSLASLAPLFSPFILVLCIPTRLLFPHALYSRTRFIPARALFPHLLFPHLLFPRVLFLRHLFPCVLFLHLLFQHAFYYRLLFFRALYSPALLVFSRAPFIPPCTFFHAIFFWICGFHSRNARIELLLLFFITLRDRGHYLACFIHTHLFSGLDFK